jgi:hypothetical protein
MELAGKLLTVAGVLLPVFGVFARSVAMVSTGISAIPPAVAAGLPELALSGLTPTLVLMLLAAAAFSGASFARRRHARAIETQRELDKVSDDLGGVGEAVGIHLAAGLEESFDDMFVSGYRVLFTILAVGVAVFLPGFPVSVVFVAALFLILRWSRGLVKRYVEKSLHTNASASESQQSIYPLVAVLVGSLLLAAVWAGLAGFGVGAVLSRFEFESGSSLSDGTYVRLAETESRIYVMTCGEYRSFEIPADQVKLVEFSPRGGVSAPSLWSVIRGAPIALGLRAQCGNG